MKSEAPAPGSFYLDVYRMVRRIPRGRVTTYGHVAALCGKPRAARTVGWALHALAQGSNVPWQRVINARGGISISKVGLPPELQRALLEAEGVEFRLDGTVDLRHWGWAGPRRAPRHPRRRATTIISPMEKEMGR